jgi:hypothetical protein
MDYKLNNNIKPNKFIIEADQKRRLKVEKAAKRKLTDEEWANYKCMTTPKPKDS